MVISNSPHPSFSQVKGASVKAAKCLAIKVLATQHDIKLTLDSIREGRVQGVDDLLKAVGGVLPSLLVENVDLDAPFAHGKALLHGGLVAESPC